MSFYHDDDPPPSRVKLFKDLDRFSASESTGRNRLRTSQITARMRKRLLRNICIVICHRAGISDRKLAGVFGLGPSRIAAIRKEIEAKCSGRSTEAESPD